MLNLLVVDSPAKVKRWAGFLGMDWRVEACEGYVRDLPTASLGVDVGHDFALHFEVLDGCGNLVRRLSRSIAEADQVFFATDPDGDGEVMAWHVLELAR